MIMMDGKALNDSCQIGIVSLRVWLEIKFEHLFHNFYFDTGSTRDNLKNNLVLHITYHLTIAFRFWVNPFARHRRSLFNVKRLSACLTVEFARRNDFSLQNYAISMTSPSYRLGFMYTPQWLMMDLRYQCILWNYISPCNNKFHKMFWTLAGLLYNIYYNYIPRYVTYTGRLVKFDPILQE